MKEIDLTSKPQWFKNELARQLAPKLQLPCPAPNLEPAPSHESLGQKETPRPDRPVGIRIVEHRYRLTDYGGSSEKYLVDAIVSAGLLPDDRLAFVKKIEKEQIKIKPPSVEQTLVEIYNARMP